MRNSPRGCGTRSRVDFLLTLRTLRTPSPDAGRGGYGVERERKIGYWGLEIGERIAHAKSAQVGRGGDLIWECEIWNLRKEKKRMERKNGDWMDHARVRGVEGKIFANEVIQINLKNRV